MQRNSWATPVVGWANPIVLHILILNCPELIKDNMPVLELDILQCPFFLFVILQHLNIDKVESRRGYSNPAAPCHRETDVCFHPHCPPRQPPLTLICSFKVDSGAAVCRLNAKKVTGVFSK